MFVFRRQFKSSHGSTVIEYGILIAAIVCLSLVGISFLGSKVGVSFEDIVTNFHQDDKASSGDGSNGSEDPVIVVADKTETTGYTSCNDAYVNGEVESGVYRLTINGHDMNAYCEMMGPSSGNLEGGWMAALWELEKSERPFGEGIDYDRPAAGYLDSSFSLSEEQIPSGVSRSAYGISSFETTTKPTMIDAVTTAFVPFMFTKVGEGVYKVVSTLASGIKNDVSHNTFSVDYVVGGTFDPGDKSIINSGSSDNYSIMISHFYTKEVFFQYSHGLSDENARGAFLLGEDKSSTADKFAWVLWIR